MKRDPITKLEFEYEKYPRIFIISFLALILILLIVQSYFAEPRSFLNLFYDCWEIIFLFSLLMLVFIVRKPKFLLFCGIILLVLSSLMFFKIMNFIKLPFGTLFFLGAIWFIGDYINYKIFKKSIFSELLKGNYNIALGLLISTLLLGVLVEVVNIPFRLWWYVWPIPSLHLWGVPVVYVVFGWLPWIFAMFVLFYPIALIRPKHFRNIRK